MPRPLSTAYNLPGPGDFGLPEDYFLVRDDEGDILDILDDVYSEYVINILPPDEADDDDF